MSGPQLEDVTPDAGQIALCLEVLFGYSTGLVAVRNFAEKGQPPLGRPRNLWIPAGSGLSAAVADLAAAAASTRTGLYVIPGTVSASGEASAHHVVQMQSIVVDIDDGDVQSKVGHIVRYLGTPTLSVDSGGLTEEGQNKKHLHFQLTEPVAGSDIQTLCEIRDLIAAKVGADRSFASAHQPIRVAGSLYHKHGSRNLVRISERSRLEHDFIELIDAARGMPAMPGLAEVPRPKHAKPDLDKVLVTPVREGHQDSWSRFEGASRAIGHFVRMAHDGRMSWEDAREAAHGYNQAMLQPPWPDERLEKEFHRLRLKHLAQNGAPRPLRAKPEVSRIPVHSLGSMIGDRSPMPADLIGPRLLTQRGMLVLGGAPKVGKTDLLANLLVHAAAGVPFLGFTPTRPLRVFYLQAEMEYHYLRERLQQMALAPELLKQAADRFYATSKLRMILDDSGLAAAAEAVLRAFPDERPDIICIDPLRNVFDGGSSDKSENDNDAMIYFLQNRIEALRDVAAPDAGIILAHHTRKLGKSHFKEDPFQAFSGASALRGFYTAGMLLFRPNEEQPERELHVELRNGPSIGPFTIDKIDGEWVEISRSDQRLVRKEAGFRFDAERVRRREVILGLLYDEALKGRLYTIAQFAQTFENKCGLGGDKSIRDRINVLATKGFVRFVTSVPALGLMPSRSKFGYLCVEGMRFQIEVPSHETGEISTTVVDVLPTHYKCPLSGFALPVTDPHTWHYSTDEDA